jgi:predicted dehydrogenase
MDVFGADQMLAAAERNGVSLGLVMNHRYFPDNIRVRSAICEGALGKLLIGSVLHSSSLTGDPDNTSPWRGHRGLAAGGILTTQAIHFLDLLLWFMGPVRSVQAYADTLIRTRQDYEDTAAVALRLESGALATLITTNGSPIADDFTGTRIEVQGSAGHVLLQGDRLRNWSCGEYAEPPVNLPELPDQVKDIVFGPGHMYEVIDFVRAVRRGSPAPVAGVDGRHLMAVVAAAYESARTGSSVSVVEPNKAYSVEEADPHSLLSVNAGPPAHAIRRSR